MSLTFRAISEDRPGPKWAGLFAEYWPSYKAWWSREGLAGRPTYMECRRALRHHMPELSGLYDDLCELVGGGDLAARFLSFYRPPPYLSGCSQAVWQGPEPLIVRNYDYNANAFDAVVLRTRWLDRQVIGTSDGLVGLVDGMKVDRMVRRFFRRAVRQPSGRIADSRIKDAFSIVASDFGTDLRSLDHAVWDHESPQAKRP